MKRGFKALIGTKSVTHRLFLRAWSDQDDACRDDGDCD